MLIEPVNGVIKATFANGNPSVISDEWRTVIEMSKGSNVTVFFPVTIAFAEPKEIAGRQLANTLGTFHWHVSRIVKQFAR